MKIVTGILVTALTLLNILDIYSTAVLLSTGNYIEANPIMLWFITEFGLLPGLIIPKGVALIVLIIIYIKFLRDKTIILKKQSIAALIIFICTCFYFHVLYKYNFKLLISL